MFKNPISIPPADDIAGKDNQIELTPMAYWTGYVESIDLDEHTFSVIIQEVDEDKEPNAPKEYATFDIDKLTPVDQARLTVGNYFCWIIGREEGNNKTISAIRLYCPPPLTSKEIEEAEALAKSFMEIT